MRLTPDTYMTETSSTLIDLGNHALEMTEKHLLIVAYPVDTGPVPAVQLDREEAYKLLTALQALFQ